jgi:hypothetical protein
MDIERRIVVPRTAATKSSPKDVRTQMPSITST